MMNNVMVAMRKIQDTLIERCYTDDGLYFRFERWEALVTNPSSISDFLVYISRPVWLKPEGHKQFIEMINDWRKNHSLEFIKSAGITFMLSDKFPKENNILADLMSDRAKKLYGLEMNIIKKDNEINCIDDLGDIDDLQTPTK